MATLPVATFGAAPEPDAARDLESATRDGRTAQGSLLLMAPVTDGHLDALLKVLADITTPPGGEDLEVNPIIPFRRLETVHFSRILIHPASPSAASPIPVWNGVPQASGPPIPAKLLFSTDFDGTLADHIDELLRVAGAGLDQLFAHVDGWPGSRQRDAAHRFFEQHRLESNTFYTGTMNRSVPQIRREALLRAEIENFLDASRNEPGFPTDAVQVRARIRDWVFAQKRFEWVKEQPGPFPAPIVPASLSGSPMFLPLVGIVVAVVVLWILGLISPALPILFVAAAVAGVTYLFQLAKTDPVIISDDVQRRTAELVKTENRIVQNEMSSVIYVKRPLWFRGLVLKLVLAFINVSAKYLSNEGTLAGIPSIHFARWVVVDDGRRLLFFSNFDGSWENYLGDFIDKAHTGLTAVWSNCVGFPRTVGLTGKGATDEQNFKAYSRASQVPTQVWYSAYRWLSVQNINDNTRLRQGLFGDMTADQAQHWLRFAVARKNVAVQKASPSAETVVELEDAQGLVARSYQRLEDAIYLPIVFDPQDRAASRAWLGEVIGRVTPASRSSKTVEADGWALNVAFTYPGLQALGLDDKTAVDFSREFKEGMAASDRQRLLGDMGPAAPDKWVWGGRDKPIHAMLFLFASSPEGLSALRLAELSRAAKYHATVGDALDSIMLPGQKEHFGFHDGIGQPRIGGFKGDGDSAERGPMIPPGEVLLGYPNAYNILPMSPSVPDDGRSRATLVEAPPDPANPGAARRRDLGRNGSYVVFRTLEQDVRGFWEYVDRCAQSNPDERKRFASKMVGRWPNGAPLVLYPDSEPAAPKTLNAFMYEDDLAGDRCPVGAHIRRSNPRDGLMPDRADSLLVADRHRLLRRGRAYGPPLASSFDPAEILKSTDTRPRGLHFVCFNTDLARQFEFVQNTWVNSMKFDGMYEDPDPIVAPHVDPNNPPHTEEIANFTMQRCPVRQRLTGVPRFVTMIGGAYLFMPSLRAMKYLATNA